MTDSHDVRSDEEIARLRERLAYYESFDELIQKSFGDAGAILREAVEMREQASRESAIAASQSQSVQRTQLESFRTIYSEMLDDITALQGQAERLARRLSDAIDALEAELHPDVEFPSLPNSLTPEIASSIDEPVEIAGSVENEATREAIAAGDSGSTEADVSTKTAFLDETDEAEVLSEPTRFILLVHGVPNAATALALKSHLDGLPAVSQVEPREFAAGMLRLQLEVERGLTSDDLKTWDAGKEVAVVHSRPGLLEVKLS